jgi:hypothetical protein
MRTQTPARAALAASSLFLLSLFPALSQTELIVNGGFESGTSSWTVAGGAGAYSQGGSARSGTNYLWLGGLENEVDSAYQTVSIPANATSATLSFYYNITSDEDLSGAYDTFTATIRNSGGSLLATVGNWSNINQDTGPGNPYYHLATYNLLPYAGQIIRIQIGSANDATFVTSFYVDDVSVQVQAVAVPPTNDMCGSAIAMTAGTAYGLNTANATSIGDPTPGCQSSFGKGVWYSFIPASSGTFTISTCGSDFDTALAVYTGACGALTQTACNDQNGPACAGNQASVSFVATAGTRYMILAGGVAGASGNLSILAAPSSGLKIIPTFDSSITSDPQAATIQATINAAIAAYAANFSDQVTVSIKFQSMGSGLGMSSFFYETVSYSSYRAALVTHATTADDNTALAFVPNTGNNPVNANASVNITLPLARALGYSNSDPPVGQFDGTISLNLSLLNYSSISPNPSKYSLFATASHEIDEVLGLGSALNALLNGAPAPTGPISPEDLFRYDISGVRSFTTAANASAWFSLDGSTRLARFNQQQGGDFQDWYSFSGGQVPRVQDAYAAQGAFPLLGVELTVLDVLGYHRIISIAPPILSLKRLGSNVVVTWPTNSTGFTLQSSSNVLSAASWTNTAPSPVIVNGQYTVTNGAAGGPKFYRLMK